MLPKPSEAHTVQPALPVSNRPDLKITDRLVSVDAVCLAAAGTIATIVLASWLVPALGALLPGQWSLMKANTSVAVLLSVSALLLTRREGNAGRTLFARLCIVGVLSLAASALFEYWTGRDLGLDTLLASDPLAPFPGRMAMQTAGFLLLFSGSTLIERTRQDWLGHILDALLLLMVLFGMLLAAGSAFNAVALLGQGSSVRTSPLTLSCLLLLTVSQACRRAPYGYFSVLVGGGIGSKFARVAVPTSQLLVFLFIGAGERLLTGGYLTLPYATALTASSLAGLLLLLNVVLARKVNTLERALRDMSLTDELTGLHNRRSFYLLGEQAVRDARREASSLTVLFFDADGLKKVNDSFGHDVGSEFLRDVAQLLSTTFRSNDVVGRLGGDEFAVIAHGSEADLSPALRRLEKAIEGANGTAKKPYRVSVSVGVATTEPPSVESFAELVDRADAAMYRDKRQRRATREAMATPQPAVAQVESSRG